MTGRVSSQEEKRGVEKFKSGATLEAPLTHTSIPEAKQSLAPPHPAKDALGLAVSTRVVMLACVCECVTPARVYVLGIVPRAVVGPFDGPQMVLSRGALRFGLRRCRSRVVRRQGRQNSMLWPRYLPGSVTYWLSSLGRGHGRRRVSVCGSGGIGFKSRGMEERRMEPMEDAPMQSGRHWGRLSGRAFLP